MMNAYDIARICHQANKALCEFNLDNSQVDWKDAPAWQQTSAIVGVKFNLANPEAPASASHESWLKQKEQDGWKYGPAKDAEKKEHPCYVPYEKLPLEQQAKDHLFKAIVGALAPFTKE